MAYEAPRVSEVGSVRGLTLGSLKPTSEKDSTTWFGIPIGWEPGNPGTPVGSR